MSNSSKRRLVITAVLAGSSQSEVARTYGVSQGWISRLMKLYEGEGEEAFEPRSRAPKTSARFESHLVARRRSAPGAGAPSLLGCRPRAGHGFLEWRRVELVGLAVSDQGHTEPLKCVPDGEQFVEVSDRVGESHAQTLQKGLQGCATPQRDPDRLPTQRTAA